jgi:arginyl-tRNA synthetase
LSQAGLGPLTSEHERAVINRLEAFPQMVADAAADLAPHSVAFYLKDLAADFHSWYNASQFLVDDAALREARLALAAATRQVIANGLALLGVSAPERM